MKSRTKKIVSLLLALCLPALCAQAASGQISGHAWQAQNGDTTYDAGDRALTGVVVGMLVSPRKNQTFGSYNTGAVNNNTQPLAAADSDEEA